MVCIGHCTHLPKSRSWDSVRFNFLLMHNFNVTFIDQCSSTIWTGIFPQIHTVFPWNLEDQMVYVHLGLLVHVTKWKIWSFGQNSSISDLIVTVLLYAHTQWRSYLKYVKNCGVFESL